MKSNWQLLSFGCGLVGATFLFSSGCSDKFGSCEERLTCVDGGAGDGNEGGSGGDGTGGSGTGGAATGGSGGETACEATCAGDTPHCDEESGECVGCVESEHCEDGVCDPDTRACVGCLEVTDCGAGAAVCNEDQECEGCSEDEDCERFGTTPTCEEDSGTCVRCTADDESACGEFSCNPATNTCTTTERESRGTCQTCVADSECNENYACVPMQFQGEDRDGGYCLKAASAPGGCPGPYGVPTGSRVSLSGATATNYCGVNETVTTCEAVIDLLSDLACDEDADCGADGLDDGRCETVNFNAGRCTLSCDGSANCSGSYVCNSLQADPYCGGPT